jgi:hypothetical protein
VYTIYKAVFFNVVCITTFNLAALYQLQYFNIKRVGRMILIGGKVIFWKMVTKPCFNPGIDWIN